jgi:hypothetical protein
MMTRIRRAMLRPYSIYIASPTIAWVAATVIFTASVKSAGAQQAAAKGEMSESQHVLTDEERRALEERVRKYDTNPQGATPPPGTLTADRPCAQRNGVLRFNPSIPCPKRLAHRSAKLRETVCGDPTLAHLDALQTEVAPLVRTVFPLR